MLLLNALLVHDNVLLLPYALQSYVLLLLNALQGYVPPSSNENPMASMLQGLLGGGGVGGPNLMDMMSKMQGKF